MPSTPTTEEIYRQLGARITKARRQAKATQDTLASKIGLTRTSVVNIEKGRQKLLVHTLIDIGKHLNTTAVELLEGLGERPDLGVAPELVNFSAGVQEFILSGARRAKKSKHQKRP